MLKGLESGHLCEEMTTKKHSRLKTMQRQNSVETWKYTMIGKTDEQPRYNQQNLIRGEIGLTSVKMA